MVNDNGTMKQVALTDFETYFESALDTLSNVTTIGTRGSLAVTGDLTVNTNVLKVDTSNNRVGIIDATPAVTLDIGSATDAVHVPTGTTAQRPGSPSAGMLRFNTTLGRFEGHDGSNFAEIGGGGTNTFTVNTYTTANNSTTAFTLSQAPNSEDNLLVFVEGVFMLKKGKEPAKNCDVTTLGAHLSHFQDTVNENMEHHKTFQLATSNW